MNDGRRARVMKRKALKEENGGMSRLIKEEEEDKTRQGRDKINGGKEGESGSKGRNEN